MRAAALTVPPLRPSLPVLARPRPSSPVFARPRPSPPVPTRPCARAHPSIPARPRLSLRHPERESSACASGHAQAVMAGCAVLDCTNA
eukprot:6942052-Prymnesium_polylepis.2